VAVKLLGTGLTGNGGGGITQLLEVFAFNDLGMHCLDKDFSVFSILPPFNVLHAQVVRKGVSGSKPQILNDTRRAYPILHSRQQRLNQHDECFEDEFLGFCSPALRYVITCRYGISGIQDAGRIQYDPIIQCV
jgi:hypothetical protein